jgi:hypothetical protein
MRTLKIIGVVLAILILGIIGLVARFWWATLTPKVPKYWPQGSVWVEAPPAPLDWSPRGYFAGCLFDSQRSVDRCKFANYRGKVWYEADYVNCENGRMGAEGTLAITAQADWTWLNSEQLEVPRVHLKNGAILIPVTACKARQNTPNATKTEPNTK